MTDRAAIAIMARSPRADLASIKTRLIPVLPDPKDRRAVYTAFLTDTIARCRRVPEVSLRVAYTPEGGADGFSECGVHVGELLVQRGDDLGAREQALFDDLFAAGFGGVVVIGSDLPTLPTDRLVDAVHRLTASVDATRLVLGPSEDGGYYLIGLNALVTRRAPADVFRGIRWSTPFTLGDTLARAEEAGLTVQLLASWHDVDDEPSFERLVRELADPGVASDSPATARVLARFLGG